MRLEVERRRRTPTDSTCRSVTARISDCSHHARPTSAHPHADAGARDPECAFANLIKSCAPSRSCMALQRCSRRRSVMICIIVAIDGASSPPGGVAAARASSQHPHVPSSSFSQSLRLSDPREAAT